MKLTNYLRQRLFLLLYALRLVPHSITIGCTFEIRSTSVTGLLRGYGVAHDNEFRFLVKGVHGELYWALDPNAGAKPYKSREQVLRG